MRTEPSGFAVLNHQLRWLRELQTERRDGLVYTRHVVRNGLYRLLSARNRGRMFKTEEVEPKDLGHGSIMDARIARDLDYVLEQVEEICTAMPRDLDALHRQVQHRYQR